MLAQDVIANTILGNSTSYTTANGYSGAAPTGRYFASIQSSGCIKVYRGPCEQNGQIVAGPADHHYVYGPLFGRIDMGVTKRFEVTRKVNGELRIEVLNALNSIDFQGLTTVTGTTI